jgi:hypothetical protein
MRFVTLNLDRSDAATLRNAVEVALTMCSCHAGACPRCDTLGAICFDLNRLLGGGSRAQHAADDRYVFGDPARARIPNPEPEPTTGAARRLWLVPAANPDA